MILPFCLPRVKHGQDIIQINDNMESLVSAKEHDRFSEGSENTMDCDQPKS